MDEIASFKGDAKPKSWKMPSIANYTYDMYLTSDGFKAITWLRGSGHLRSPDFSASSLSAGSRQSILCSVRAKLRIAALDGHKDPCASYGMVAATAGFPEQPHVHQTSSENYMILLGAPTAPMTEQRVHEWLMM